MSHVTFYNSDKSQKAEAEAGRKDPKAPDQFLNENEHIIGIYGVKEQSNSIFALGFIVYKAEN